MDLARFDEGRRPGRAELPEIGRVLLGGLSAHLGTELLVFRAFYVEEGALTLTFRAKDLGCAPLDLRLEGCLMFAVRGPGVPPSVHAEILVFSLGGRIGPARHNALSYLQMTYDISSDSWGEATWLADGPEDWEGVTEPRWHDDVRTVTTFDFEQR